MGSNLKIQCRANVNRNIAIYYFHRLRELIFEYQEKENIMFSGEIEIDDSNIINNYSFFSNYINTEENCLQDRDSNNVSNFMKAFLTIEFGITKFIKDDMVYEEFKKYLEKKIMKMKKLLQLILEYSKCYNIILNKNHGINLGITKSISNINELEIIVLSLLILCILKLEMDKKISTGKAFCMINLLENYLVRRLICSILSNALNKVVISLINKLNVKNSEDSIIKAFEEYLFSIGLSGRFPKDKEVKESLITRLLHGNRYSISLGRFLLSLLENTYNKEKNSLEDISIEHIMSQNLYRWEEYLDENYKEIYERYIHTLGNLTLTGYNPELSNNPMEVKQPLLADSKFRYLNEEFSSSDIVWNEDAVLNRTSRLTDAILNIYPSLNVEIDTSNIESDILEYEFDDYEDFTNIRTRIIKYTYKDNTYEIDFQAWSDFIVQICGHIYKDHSVEFHQYIIENTDFENKVSYDDKFKYHKKTISVNDRTLYFNTNNNTNDKISFLVKVLETLKLDILDTDDVSLFVKLENRSYKMIISASRRTDIPTYYSEWFLNRIKEGFVYVRNPINKNQVSKICLSPNVVDCIVFWTKNPKPMLDKLDKLKDYKYYFQFTLTSYGNDIEKNLPSKNGELIKTFKKLSDLIGKERVIWRYDPILLTEKYNMSYHIKYFESIAKKLEGYTEKCIVSFIDIYSKVKRNAKEFNLFELNENQIKFISKALSEVASAYNFSVETCGEPISLEEFGIKHAKCIDDKLISKIMGYDIEYKKDKNQRLPCGCIESIDIGAYNTCSNKCVYCYANYSEKMIDNSHSSFDVNSPILCDTIKDSDIKRVRNIKRIIKDKQLELFN